METMRRLNEIKSYKLGADRVSQLKKVINRKNKKLNDNEKTILDSFPSDGINIGFVSNTLIYSPVLRRMTSKDHIAIVSLLNLHHLEISYKDGYEFIHKALN